MLIIIVIALSITFTSCKKDPTGPEGGYETITITHAGIDWSTKKTGNEVSYDQIDGETISWCEPGVSLSNVTGIWYRSFNQKVYRVGNVDISSVASVNQSAWQNDVCATPLANGDVWVVQARDGYVIFKVTDKGDINSTNWAVKVQYKFSADGNFK